MVNLLVGLAMGLSMLSAASAWFNLQWLSDRQILSRNYTQQETRALMDTMVHDIRKSNFQALTLALATQPVGNCPSEFCGLKEDFEVSNHQILFSMDRNGNGKKDSNECSGFRLSGQELQIKTSCQRIVWTALNDSQNLQILELSFDLECDNSHSNQGDLLTVLVRSQSASEKIPRSVHRIVRFRNHSAHQRQGTGAGPCENTSL